MKKENEMAGKAAAETPLAAVPDAPVEKEATVKQRLLGQAMIALRERHREEYDQIASTFFTEVGLTYTRRLTDRERAERKILDLARENGITVRLGEEPIVHDDTDDEG